MLGGGDIVFLIIALQKFARSAEMSMQLTKDPYPVNDNEHYHIISNTAA